MELLLVKLKAMQRAERGKSSRLLLRTHNGAAMRDTAQRTQIIQPAANVLAVKNLNALRILSN